MNWEPGRCKPGDMIRVRIGSIYHYGVFVSEEEVIAFGLPPVREYMDHPDRLRVCATDIDVFACGSIVEIAVPDRAERKKRIPPKKSIALARSRIGETGYNLLHNNCEHFANECVFGERRCELEEWAYRQWRSRPICNVYVTRLAARDAADETAERKMILLAARHCFGLEEEAISLRRSENGGWNCDRFCISTANHDGWLAAAVSNKEIAVEIGSSVSTSGAYSCVLPAADDLRIALRGEHAGSAHFYLTDGLSVKLQNPTDTQPV